jgi:aryl-alcohol dehydrogenase-like predicted oxidoreductase
MEMSVHYGLRDPVEGARCIARAVELGVTLFDTADAYGPYVNEELVGRALAPYRDRVNVSTKVGLVHTPDGLKPCGRPEHIRQACEGSLTRLGVETIDLWYLHRPDPDVPIEETFAAMASMVEAGKVRFLGLSEAGVDQLERAARVHPVTALQSEWSLWSREIETEVLPAARRLGTAVVAYCPLGQGFLTGSLRSPEELAPDDLRRSRPWFQEPHFSANVALADGVRMLAARCSATPAQLALAWLLAQGDDVFPIPGTDRVTHLEENVAACGLSIPPEVMADLEALCAPAAVSGRRLRTGG